MGNINEENKVECYIRVGHKTAAGGLVYRTLAQAKSAWSRPPPCMWKITSDKDGSNPTIEVICKGE
jgi:hypothetical protein